MSILKSLNYFAVHLELRMVSKKSCLLKSLKISFVLIFLIGVLIYILTREKNYTSLHPTTQGKTATIILIDGLSNAIFRELMNAGKLPHLQTLINESTYIEHGIAAFPSMTGYGFYPFLTGEDAAKSGILGLRWFDRQRDTGNLRNYVGRTNIWMNHDINPLPKTLFEEYDGYYTASINTYMNRGVHHSEMTSWAHTTAKYQDKSAFRYLRQVPTVGDDWVKNHFEHENLVMEKALAQLHRNPKVQWITFPSPDASNHIAGTTDEYYRLISHIDSLVGVFRQAVSRLGQTHSRLIAVVTDHGISDVSKNLDLPNTLRQTYGIDLIRGNSANIYSLKLSELLSDFVEKNGYFVINGNLSAYIYLRNPVAQPSKTDWRKPLPFSTLEQYPTEKGVIHLPKIIAATEGVELVACRANDSTVSVFSATAHADIIFNKNTKRYRYAPLTADDPLQYKRDSVLNKMIKIGFYTPDEWLAASVHTDFPDALHRLYQLMSADKVGDLLITSQKGYDLAADYEVIVKNYKGGHGGLRGELLAVPYIVHLPNQPSQRIPYLRAEDVGRLIARYLKPN